MKNLTSNEIQMDSREKPINFKRFLAGSFAAAALFSSPMLEQSAFAQSPQPQVTATARRDVHYEVTGSTQVSLPNGSSRIQVHMINNLDVPSVNFDGPAVVNARLYPVITQSEAQNGNVPISIEYSVDGVAQPAVAFSTSLSTISEEHLAASGRAVGTPKEFSITVSGNGIHHVSVSRPIALLEIVSVLAPEQPVNPIVVPPVVPVQPVQQSHIPDTAPHVNPAQETRQINSIRSRLSLNHQSFWINDLGSNSGSIHELDLLYRHPLGQNFALIIGPHAGFYQTGMSVGGNATRLSIVEGTVMAGLAAYADKNTFYLTGFGGLQTALYSVDAMDGRNLSGTQYGFGYGGRVGYDYNDIVGLSAQMSNNPYNPGSLHAYLSIPYSWVHNARPTLDANLMWLHMLRPTSVDSIGGGSLDDNNLLLRAIVSVPIWRFGPVVPSAILGLNYDHVLSGGPSSDRAAFLAGGGVSLDLVNKFMLQLGGGASVPDGTPFFMVNAYMR